MPQFLKKGLNQWPSLKAELNGNKLGHFEPIIVLLILTPIYHIFLFKRGPILYIFTSKWGSVLH